MSKFMTFATLVVTLLSAAAGNLVLKGLVAAWCAFHSDCTYSYEITTQGFFWCNLLYMALFAAVGVASYKAKLRNKRVDEACAQANRLYAAMYSEGKVWGVDTTFTDVDGQLSCKDADLFWAEVAHTSPECRLFTDQLFNESWVIVTNDETMHRQIVNEIYA